MSPGRQLWPWVFHGKQGAPSVPVTSSLHTSPKPSGWPRPRSAPLCPRARRPARGSRPRCTGGGCRHRWGRGGGRRTPTCSAPAAPALRTRHRAPDPCGQTLARRRVCRPRELQPRPARERGRQAAPTTAAGRLWGPGGGAAFLAQTHLDRRPASDGGGGELLGGCGHAVCTALDPLTQGGLATPRKDSVMQRGRPSDRWGGGGLSSNLSDRWSHSHEGA